jgi:formate dehydrogenase
VVSVAEHVVMSMLNLVRNFVPAHEMIERGDWQVSDIARNAFDLEGKVIGTIGAGRIGYRVLYVHPRYSIIHIADLFCI